MELLCITNPFIPATHQRHLVYVLALVRPDAEQAAPPAPLNLGLVVDASRSMLIPILGDREFQELKRKGMARQVTVDGVQVWQVEVPKSVHIDAPSNMDFTKKALALIADMLRHQDRFSLVAFAQDALLMVSSTPGSERARLTQSIARLDQINLGDDTFMARGMEKGLEQMRAGLSPDRANRMIVLTDGYTQETSRCYEWARQAKKLGIVISTVALGLDFNEDLMISLADVSGGHAHMITDPREIPPVLSQELVRAQSVTWRDLTLSLSMPADMTLRRAHRIQPDMAELQAAEGETVARTLSLGDLEAGQPPAVLLELVAPPRPAGTFRLAQAQLTARSAQGQTNLSQDIVVRYTETPSQSSQTDPQLMDAVQKVSVFKLHNQAIQDAERGNTAGATKRLRLAGERLIEMGQENLGQSMIVEAELMEKEGRGSTEGTKKLRYGARKI